MTRASGRVARALPLVLAAVLATEAIVAAALHRSDAELAAAAARSGDVHDRAGALYRLARRDEGAAATEELRAAAAEADPRLAVLVTGVLDTDPGARLRRRALVSAAPTPEARRYLELMFERARTSAQYRELLARRAP